MRWLLNFFRDFPASRRRRHGRRRGKPLSTNPRLHVTSLEERRMLDAAQVSVAKLTNGDGSEAGPDDGQFTVTLSAASSTDTTVTYTLAGSAAEGSDYATIATHSVTIAANTTSAVIDIDVTDDSLVEATETVTVTLTGVTGDAGITLDDANKTASLNITDNDSAKVSVAKSADGDGSETGPDDGQFTVTLSAASSTDTTVTYTLAGTAAEGSDYATIVTQSVTIAANTTTAVIDIDVTDDGLVEATETVTVTLTGVTGDANITRDTQ